MGGAVFIALWFEREIEREVREHARVKRLRALHHAHGHTLDYVGGGDQTPVRSSERARSMPCICTPRHLFCLDARVKIWPWLPSFFPSRERVPCVELHVTGFRQAPVQVKGLEKAIDPALRADSRACPLQQNHQIPFIIYFDHQIRDNSGR